MTSAPLDEMIRVVRFVPTEADVPAARRDTVVVVLDPAWTPMPGGRADILAGRPLLGGVVAARDLFNEALARIDDWADRSEAADRLLVEGVTYWFRMRETMWRWAHERLLWRHVLGSIGLDGRAIGYGVPTDEAALRDVAARLGTVDAVDGSTTEDQQAPLTPAAATSRATTSVSALQALPRRVLPRIRRLVGAATGTGSSPVSQASDERITTDPRTALLLDRVARISGTSGHRVVVLATPVTYQRIAAVGDRRDPILESVVEELEAAGTDVTLLAMGLDQRRDGDWATLAADERMLPQSLLAVRWAGPDDRARADRALASVGAAVESLRETRFEFDGVDLTDTFVDALAERLAHIVRNDLLQQARVERFIAELEPTAIVLAQEGIRVPWLVAGRDAGVPVFAVQHGILYPGHPGYPHRRHPAVARAAKTFVYGPYERTMLLERGAYLDTEVEVSGSPRLDLDSGGATSASDRTTTTAAERDAVREELGVRDGDRLLVVSTVNVPFVQRAHFAPMVDRLLGGPLPRVHVVFKLHPGEREDGPYRSLLVGLARARGHEPPPISVVRDIDLYHLLRAADAHLGLHSTVLTDAVAVGTPNLIATMDAHADILGYVDAGVARPVSDAREVLAALDTPAPAGPAARAAFLARHFLEGRAGARIVAGIRNATGAVGVRAS